MILRVCLPLKKKRKRKKAEIKMSVSIPRRTLFGSLRFYFFNGEGKRKYRLTEGRSKVYRAM